MELEELYLKRQSTREYADRPIPEKTLEEICRLAVLAPSAVNSQPYRLHVISGDRAKEFAHCVQPDGAGLWTSGCAAFIAIEQGEGFRRTMPDGTVAVKADFVPYDIGIMTAYLVLAAEHFGVQSCILGRRDESAIARFLGLGQTARFPLVVALGYAAEGYPVRRKTRRPLAESCNFIK